VASASELRIEKLTRTHSVETFDCGAEPLNRFLIRYALANQLAGSSTTYLALSGATVAGYYTLTVGQVEYEAASERMKKGLARHPVPIMILARLAVSSSYQGHGLGSGMLKDAMLRTLAAADIAGIRAFVVHAKDDAAKSFYERYDLLPSPTDPYHLYRLLKDIRALAQAGAI
jgi:GNAT superfamily N-acetyltransferase